MRPEVINRVIDVLGEPRFFQDVPVRLIGQHLERRFWVWFVGETLSNHGIHIDEKTRWFPGEPRFSTVVRGRGYVTLETHDLPSDDVVWKLIEAVNLLGKPLDAPPQN